MIEIEKYCYITQAQVALILLFMIARVFYLGLKRRLAYEGGFLAIIFTPLYSWGWNRCEYCPDCWFASWMCSVIQNIMHGWHKPLGIFSTDYINYELIKINKPFYWEFFYKSTLVIHVAEIALAVGIVILILYFTWLNYKLNHQKILTILVGKFLILICIYYLILLNHLI